MIMSDENFMLLFKSSLLRKDSKCLVLPLIFLAQSTPCITQLP